jgi:hypothetical protein
VSLETATHGKLVLARRWETIARFTIFGVMAAMVLMWVIGQPFIAFGLVFLAMPAAWLFNLRCERCGWMVYRQFGTADVDHAKDQFLAPLYSKPLWNQPEACSKCGHSFRFDDTNSRAA